MKFLLLLVVLLAALAPPVSHSAHRRVPGRRLHPLRVLRTTQGPKVVRAVR